MSSDLFERLSQLEVPPPPPAPTFDRQLHERVNRTLLLLHIGEFAFCILPWAAIHFGHAMLSAVYSTITGKFDTQPPRNPDDRM